MKWIDGKDMPRWDYIEIIEENGVVNN